MQGTTRRRLIAGALALTGLAAMAGCRPNIPLIPGIRGDVRPPAAAERSQVEPTPGTHATHIEILRIETA